MPTLRRKRLFISKSKVYSSSFPLRSTFHLCTRLSACLGQDAFESADSFLLTLSHRPYAVTFPSIKIANFRNLTSYNHLTTTPV